MPDDTIQACITNPSLSDLSLGLSQVDSGIAMGSLTSSMAGGGGGGGGCDPSVAVDVGCGGCDADIGCDGCGGCAGF